MTRYEAAVALVRAMDQFRLLRLAGKATGTDVENVKERVHDYRNV